MQGQKYLSRGSVGTICDSHRYLIGGPQLSIQGLCHNDGPHPCANITMATVSPT